MPFKTLAKYILVVLMGFVVSCSNQKNDKGHDDTVLHAYRLIDENRSAEAIELLEGALTEDPSNDEYKVVLASAYAHKGGIRIQSLAAAIQKSTQLSQLKDRIDLKTDQTIVSKVDAGAANFAAMLVKFSATIEVFTAVPRVDRTQAIYLVQAINLLNSLGQRIKPEDVIYRGVLQIVLLKHYLAEDLIGEFVPPEVQDESSCRIDLANVNDSIIKIGELLIDIFNDNGFANPKQAEDMKRLAAETSQAISSLTIATTAVTLADQAANIFLKQVAIQNGFGKIIKCGGN